MSHSPLLIGVFDSEEKFVLAAKAAKKTGLPLHDAFTPFPVHGMDEILSVGKSRLPRLCFIFGAAGLISTLAFQSWVSVFDWPMNIGGKAYNASPALIPIAFELTVLFAGLGTVFSFLRFRGLYPGKKPAISGLGATNDRFLLAFREGPEGSGAEVIKRFLNNQGAASVHEARR